jgi:hypothetical protein
LWAYSQESRFSRRNGFADGGKKIFKNSRGWCVLTEDGERWQPFSAIGEYPQRCYAEVLCFSQSLAFYEGTGEGGIRTLGSLLGYGALAKRCFQPLSHLTKSKARISQAILDFQFVICVS